MPCHFRPWRRTIQQNLETPLALGTRCKAASGVRGPLNKVAWPTKIGDLGPGRCSAAPGNPSRKHCQRASDGPDRQVRSELVQIKISARHGHLNDTTQEY